MATEMVHLPEVKRLSQTCIRILGGNPGKFTLQGTNTYLLGTGHRRILIDTGQGMPCWKATLKATLQMEEAVIESVLITHWHGDHQGGIKDVLDLSPNARVFKCKPQSGQADISDGQKFEVPGATITAVYTPGHTVDHMVFILQEDDAMLTGDNVLGHGTSVFEDLATYLSSLDRMKGLFRGPAYPGHGPVIEDGPARVIEYINHRRQRETQVLQLLESGNFTGGDTASWTAMDIVKTIYADVPVELHSAACGSVNHILQKLEKEGRVKRDAQSTRWRL